MGENIVYDNDSYGTFFDNATSETSLLNDRYVPTYPPNKIIFTKAIPTFF